MTDGAKGSANEISTRILDFIRGELLDEDIEVGLEDDLLSGEVLYSLAVMRLASWVEETFTIELTPEYLSVDIFKTVAALTDFVVSATKGTDAVSGP